MNGIREKLNSTDGSKIYLVKTRRWPTDMVSVRRQPCCKDTFVVAHPSFFRKWHKNKGHQITLLHELGHLKTDFFEFSHFAKELFATVYGFFAYRKLIGGLTLLHLAESIMVSWKYMTSGANWFEEKFNSISKK